MVKRKSFPLPGTEKPAVQTTYCHNPAAFTTEVKYGIKSLRLHGYHGPEYHNKLMEITRKAPGCHEHK